jgi:hypothetical protein
MNTELKTELTYLPIWRIQVLHFNQLDLTSSEDLTQLDVQNNTLYCLVL